MRHLRSAAVLVTSLLVGVAVAYAAQNFTQGTISAAGTDCSTATRCVVASVRNTPKGAIQVLGQGAFSATILLEGTVDDSNWQPLQVTRLYDGTLATSVNATGLWTWDKNLSQVRARASTLGGGTATVTILAVGP